MAQKAATAFLNLGGYSGPGVYTYKFTVGLADINAAATTGDTILLCNLPPRSIVTQVFQKHSVVPAAPSLTTTTSTINDAGNVYGASLNWATAVGPTASVLTQLLGTAKTADPSITTPLYMTFNWGGATAATFTAGSCDVWVTFIVLPA